MNEETNKKKKEFYKLIDKKTGVLKNPTDTAYSIPVKGFPKHLWEEWNKQCKEKYNDCRWHKIWTDHLKAMNFDTLVNSSVNTVQQEEQEEQTEKTDSPVVFGDGGKEDVK